MAVDEKYKVNGYYPTVGIECHVQLKTKTKLFSAVSNEARDAAPNTLVSHICFGLPGALPVLNEEAVRLASKAAFALGTRPQPFSKFDRKHYFYPDLPKGYQISQFDQPIVIGGNVTIHLEDGSEKTINITRAHMEEDAGKSTHPAGKDYSLVDLNRAGTPLLEIVSEPEIHSGAEAKAYAKELWLRMKYAGVSDVDLYHGNMRFDVNVSVSKDAHQFGTRSETKNLNSFKSVERAVDYEIKRQIELLEKGDSIVQETRGWLDDKQKTVSQRSKEDAHDYRYFPDPDIPPVVLDESYILEIEKSLPKMPDQIRHELGEAGIARATTESLMESTADEDYAKLVLDASGEDKKFGVFVANFIVNDYFKLISDAKSQAEEATETRRLPELSVFREVYDLFSGNEISSNSVVSILFNQAQGLQLSVEEYVEKNNLRQMSDSGELEKIVEQVIADNPKPAEDVRGGEMKAIGFLVGQVMKASKGQANPELAQKLLRDKLES